MPLSSTPGRKALVTRNTKETKIQLSLSLDGGPLDLLEYNSEFDGHSSILIPQQDSDTHASQITTIQHIWIWTGAFWIICYMHGPNTQAGVYGFGAKEIC